MIASRTASKTQELATPASCNLPHAAPAILADTNCSPSPALNAARTTPLKHPTSAPLPAKRFIAASIAWNRLITSNLIEAALQNSMNNAPN
jgi:hypothetical protein